MAFNKNYSALDHKIYLTTDEGTTFALEGAIDGDFITVEYDNDSVNAVEGAQGNVQFSQRKNSLGTVSFSGQWGAVTNENLNYVFARQQKGYFIEKLQVKRINELENTLIHDAQRAMIQKPPTNTMGPTASDKSWPFKVEGLTYEEQTAPV